MGCNWKTVFRRTFYFIVRICQLFGVLFPETTAQGVATENEFVVQIRFVDFFYRPPQDSRRFTLNTSVPPSVDESLRGFISSNAVRAVSAAPEHGRSGSLGTPYAIVTPPRKI